MFITQKSATTVISIRRSAVMFFSTASALKISRSASCHVTRRQSCAAADTWAHTAGNATGSAGAASLRWIANTPFSIPISSRALTSEATANPES